jgi:hypothetical protein
MTPPILVFAWGNPSRGDDALGPLFAERIEALGLPGVECLTDFQLQVEHALEASSACLLPQEISGEVLIEKYAKGNERMCTTCAPASPRPGRGRSRRQAPLLGSAFLEAQENGFVPAGRINSAAGTDSAPR